MIADLIYRGWKIGGELSGRKEVVQTLYKKMSNVSAKLEMEKLEHCEAADRNGSLLSFPRLADKTAEDL